MATEETPLLIGDIGAPDEVVPTAATTTAAAAAAKRRRDEIKGYIFMAASALGFALNLACVKALSISKIPALEIVFARSVLQLGLGLLGCLYYRVNPAGPGGVGMRRWLLLRGASGAFGNACFFFAVTVMPLADATVVFFTNPVFSAILASWMLSEPYGRFDKVASTLCMLGIVLVVKPTAIFHATNMDQNVNAGAAAALVGAMFAALAYCLVRKIRGSVHSIVLVVYFGFVSFCCSLVAMFALQSPRLPQSHYEWTLIVMLGCFAFLGQVLLNRGLQLAPTGPGTLMRNLDVVFSFIFGISLFGEIPDWTAVIGSFVIVACTVAMGLHKWRTR
ncbi:hypothetical protein H4R20_004220 [Coemansia guatemalensis]|uniref:EamA domain-containing protein n=1 Tax=Coemansia guatemalensis TaxID=2761395 RepID=A0A9W8HZ19_9FUNG|nr:hypothetical protein H4R20_004220 [Coemansia guatemalensis]